VTLGRFGSHDYPSGCVTSLPASYRPVGTETHGKCEHLGLPKHCWGTSGPMMTFRVMGGHFWSHCHFRLLDVISSHMTTLSSEVQVCCSSNAPKAWVFWPSQAVLGHVHSYDVTYGLCEVTSGHVTSFQSSEVFPVSYCLECAETHQKACVYTF